MTRAKVAFAVFLTGCGEVVPRDAGPGADAASDAPVPWQCTNSPDYFRSAPEDLGLPAPEAPPTLPSPDSLGPMTVVSQMSFGTPGVPGLHWSESGVFPIRYQLVTSSEQGAVRISQFAFLDDRRVPIWVGDTPHDPWQADTTSHVVDQVWEIRDVPEGVHNLFFIVSSTQLEERPGIPVGSVLTPSAGSMHTLVRGRFEWPVLEAAAGMRQPHSPGFYDHVRSRPGAPLSGGPDAAGMISLRIEINDGGLPETPLCGPDYEAWGGFVLMFDGEPVRGVGHDREVVAAPFTPFLVHSVDIDVGPLPRDGTPHRLDIVHVAGLQTAAVVDLETRDWPYCCTGYTASGLSWAD